MSRRARLTTTAVAVLLAATGAALATAAPAQAKPHGPLIPANVYFLSAKVDLDHAKDSDVVRSGTGFVTETNWRAIAVDQKCPEGTRSTMPLVRVPGPGKNEDGWEEYQLAPQSFRFDDDGRPLSFEENDGFALPGVADYLNQHGHRASDLRMVVVCLDEKLTNLGYFQTTISADNTGMSDGQLEGPENLKVYPNVVWTPQNTDLSNLGQVPAAAGAERDPFPWRGFAVGGAVVLLAGAAAVVARRGRRETAAATDAPDTADTPDQRENVPA